MISTPSASTLRVTSTLVSGSGWQSGMSSEVRLAAMIPASCAVVSASPLGSERRAPAVSALMRTRPEATARRRSEGLPPTSTMRTPPCSSTWLKPPFPGISDRESSAGRPLDGVEVGELGFDPRADVVLGHLRLDRIAPSPPFLGGHRQRRVERLRLAGEVEGVHRERPLAELVVGAGVLGEDEDAPALVHERRFLGDEIH